MKKRKCRVCGKQAAAGHADASYPFCGERCRMTDLGRWMNEAYVISTAPEDLEDPSLIDGSVPEASTRLDSGEADGSAAGGQGSDSGMGSRTE